MEQKITFSEACRLIADRTGLPRRDVDDFLRALFAGIASSLAEGEQVRLKGVGTFKVPVSYTHLTLPTNSLV